MLQSKNCKLRVVISQSKSQNRIKTIITCFRLYCINIQVSSTKTVLRINIIMKDSWSVSRFLQLTLIKRNPLAKVTRITTLKPERWNILGPWFRFFKVSHPLGAGKILFQGRKKHFSWVITFWLLFQLKLPIFILNSTVAICHPIFYVYTQKSFARKINV